MPNTIDVRTASKIAENLSVSVTKLEALQTDAAIVECPRSVREGVSQALSSLRRAVKLLPREKKRDKRDPDAPTHQQGQFLAFIHRFIDSNHAGLAPSHAELQRFFDLTPPSVNSMLKRLEQRGFIRRIPGKARAIEMLIDPEELPELERKFKVR